MRFVIAAGGTGGHLFPGLAVGEVLRTQGHEVLVFISEKEIDALATQGRSEFQLEKLPGIGMPSLFSPKIFPFLWRFAGGLRQCIRICRKFKPDAVLGMGGFTSTAPILAGRILGKPSLVHESNAIPGKANRLNARLASGVLLGFAECAAHFPKARTRVTGTPVRSSLREAVDRRRAVLAFGLEPGRKTLLVMGGSQGAHGVNRALEQAAPVLADPGLQVIHLTGKDDVESLRDAYRAAGVVASVAAFCHHMEEAYAAADLCIARSGAASLTELAYFGVPSVLVPYPHAAEDHQAVNAKLYAADGAALVLKESEIAEGRLGGELRRLLGSESELAEMRARSRALSVTDAAEQVAAVLLEVCK
jgi:UDP-N-acetylglucosamine--N-acetylmuramyl-(pentapeptide) pyrophosphoryl-undecaprenol N-acetylglucosamine transferase